MTETEHYKLKKPAQNEYYDRGTDNANLDTLDAALHGLDVGKADLDPATGKVVASQLGPTGRMLHYRDCSALLSTESLTGFFAMCRGALDDGDEVYGEMGFSGGVTDCPGGVSTESMVYIHRVSAGVYFVSLRNGETAPYEWFKLATDVTEQGGYRSLTQWAPLGGADEAVAEHDKSLDPHANMRFISMGDTELRPTLPVNADLLDGSSKEEILAAAGAAGLHLFGPIVVNVPFEGWTGTGPWEQTVSVAGVTAADNGLWTCPVDVADDAARKLYNKAYACLAAEAETVDGGIVLTCRDGKPEVSFSVLVKGVR